MAIHGYLKSERGKRYVKESNCSANWKVSYKLAKDIFHEGPNAIWVTWVTFLISPSLISLLAEQNTLGLLGNFCHFGHYFGHHLDHFSHQPGADEGEEEEEEKDEEEEEEGKMKMMHSVEDGRCSTTWGHFGHTTSSAIAREQTALGSLGPLTVTSVKEKF